MNFSDFLDNEKVPIEVRMRRLLSRPFRDEKFIEYAEALLFEAGQIGRTDTGVYSELSKELESAQLS